MGAWGTGIYSNDTAEDVRDTCKEIYPFVSVERGNEIIFEEYKEIIESDIIDDDYASFWYALADWQWKHGILNEEIKEKTISLLKNHTGIEDWEEDGDSADVRKRIAVMDKLREQFEKPQPEVKLPPAKLAKPRHKPGDVIIFRSCSSEEDEEMCAWRIEGFMPPYIFKNPVISENSENIPVVDIHNHYMAMLCVGTRKEQYSKYLPGIYNENSVYVHYDYLSEYKPTVETLKKCGFLPAIYCEYENINKKTIDFIGWTYYFTIDDSFRMSSSSDVREVMKIKCKEEVDRFTSLYAKKNYLHNANPSYGIESASVGFWEERFRMKSLGLEIDNLLDDDKFNQEFLNPTEIDEARKIWRKNRKQDDEEGGWYYV